jgi:hypothetical protein
MRRQKVPFDEVNFLSGMFFICVWTAEFTECILKIRFLRKKVFLYQTFKIYFSLLKYSGILL